MNNIIFQGRITSDFKGFNENAIFKMSNGTYWIQARYRYWYHYAYRPEAKIVQENGKYLLHVVGQSIEVKKIHNVIESNIDGTFKGWDGNSVYKLTNGQVWKQKYYKYEYTYAYRPEVIVAEINGAYIMQVEGTWAEVMIVR